MLTRDDITKKVVATIAEKIVIGVSKVVPTARIVEDLGADSLDQVEVVMDLEDTYQIEIPDEDAANFKTVNDVVDYVAKKVGAE